MIATIAAVVALWTGFALALGLVIGAVIRRADEATKTLTNAELVEGETASTPERDAA